MNLDRRTLRSLKISDDEDNLPGKTFRRELEELPSRGLEVPEGNMNTSAYDETMKRHGDTYPCHETYRAVERLDEDRRALEKPSGDGGAGTSEKWETHGVLTGAHVAVRTHACTHARTLASERASRSGHFRGAASARARGGGGGVYSLSCMAVVT